MHADLQLHVPNVWQHVREVRRRVAGTLEGLPLEVCSAAEMTAAELVENAIKYGESVPDCPDVKVAVRVTDERVTIEVTNGIRSPESIQDFVSRLDALQCAEDRERLYLERLQELMTDPNASGKLGLYRIGFEGRFDLSYACAGDVLTVKASRRMESQQP